MISNTWPGMLWFHYGVWGHKSSIQSKPRCENQKWIHLGNIRSSLIRLPTDELLTSPTNRHVTWDVKIVVHHSRALAEAICFFEECTVGQAALRCFSPRPGRTLLALELWSRVLQRGLCLLASSHQGLRADVCWSVQVSLFLGRLSSFF